MSVRQHATRVGVVAATVAARALVGVVGHSTSAQSGDIVEVGLGGTVTLANSLFGISSYNVEVTVLANGNYVVASKAHFFSARYTWGAGDSGVIGPVMIDNSNTQTSIPLDLTALDSGNYIMRDR